MVSFFLCLGLIERDIDPNRILRIFTNMKPSSINELKKDLEKRDHKELLDYCLRLIKFKKENKELLGFLLFEADDISGYIEKVKQETDHLFQEINKANTYYVIKSIRKILRNITKYIRFTLSKQVEAELLTDVTHFYPQC